MLHLSYEPPHELNRFLTWMRSPSIAGDFRPNSIVWRHKPVHLIARFDTAKVD